MDPLSELVRLVQETQTRLSSFPQVAEVASLPEDTIIAVSNATYAALRPHLDGVAFGLGMARPYDTFMGFPIWISDRVGFGDLYIGPNFVIEGECCTEEEP